MKRVYHNEIHQLAVHCNKEKDRYVISCHSQPVVTTNKDEAFMFVLKWIEKVNSSVIK